MGNTNSIKTETDQKIRISEFTHLLYETDLLVTNVYDLKSMAVLNIGILKNIFQDDLHYHATTGCSAISILKDGWKFQNEVESLGVSTLDQYLGHGIYFSEHVEKAMQYGNYIFVAKLNFEKYTPSDICVVPAMNHFSFIEYRHKNWDKINNSKLAIYEGFYDKDGQRNHFVGNDGPIKDYYTEVRIRDTNNIDLLYLIELETPFQYKLQNYHLVPAFRQMSCIMDLQNNSIILPKTIDGATQVDILTKYWYSEIEFIDILKYTRTSSLLSGANTSGVYNFDKENRNLFKVSNISKNSWDVSTNYLLIGDLYTNDAKKVSKLSEHKNYDLLMSPKYICVFNKSEYR